MKHNHFGVSTEFMTVERGLSTLTGQKLNILSILCELWELLIVGLSGIFPSLIILFVHLSWSFILHMYSLVFSQGFKTKPFAHF